MSKYVVMAGWDLMHVASPSSAFAMAVAMMAPALLSSPNSICSKSSSARMVALFRAPFGLPFGFPLLPFWNAIFPTIVWNLLFTIQQPQSWLWHLH
jgi:hypothetical protein